MTMLIAAGAIVWAAPRVATGNYRELLFAAVLAQAVWVLLRWRSSVYVFMVYVIVEGFLINYFTGVPELNLIKDVFVCLLFLVPAAFLGSRGIFPIQRMSWIPPFAAFAVVYVAEVFNPHLPNVLVGLVGLRVTLLYFLLVPVAYYFFDSRERVRHFFIFMVLFSIPVAVFGIVQYFKGPEWMISMSPGFNRAVFYAYGLQPRQETIYFRTFSTFVHTGGFSQYLAFVMLICIALWVLPSMRRHRWWIALAFLIQFSAQLTTGGRTPLVLFMVTVAFLVLMQRRSLRIAPVLVLIPALLVGTVTVVGPAFVERYSSVLDLDFVMGRNLPLLTGWLEEAMKTDWAGLGAGYATVAARYVGQTPLNIGVVENGLAKMRFEAGLPGFILYIVFLLSLALWMVRQVFRVQDRQVRWLSSACAVFLLVNLLTMPLGPVFDSSPANVYIWFFAGFLARAPLLSARPEGAAAVQAAVNS